jgi:aquaporin Z
MEAGCLGMFMLSACAFTVLLEHPESPVHQAIESVLLRRFLIGLAMGATLLAIVHSRWGKRSGAHMNPGFTLAYWSIGKIDWRDTVFYVTAQFAGGIAGVWLADLLIGFPLRHTAVNYAVTQPGPDGPVRAFLAELLISSVLMTAVLLVSNDARFSRLTPFVAASLVALYITFEAPLSGMSMNPARTFGSAFGAGSYSSLWIYFTAPPLAMLASAQLYRFFRGARAVFCAKLHHNNHERCIFRCRYDELQG